MTKKNGSNKKSVSQYHGHKFKPTEEHHEIVYRQAMDGNSRDNIRFLIKRPDGRPIAMDTFYKYFEETFREGEAQMVGKVGASAVRLATEGKPSMPMAKAQELILKCRGGWKESQNVEVTGQDGGPVEHEHSLGEGVEQSVTTILEQLAAGKARSSSSET